MKNIIYRNSTFKEVVDLIALPDGYLQEGDVLELVTDEEAQLIQDQQFVIAREWRNKELDDSDWICAISDHGLHASYMTYRILLRDWPSTSDFPGTKPTL